MKKLKWGFIGCGEVTETKSGPAFNEVEGSEVVAVMSRNGKKARSYAERHGVKKWYTDAQELIDDPKDEIVETIRSTARFGEKYALAKYDAICTAAKDASVFGRALPSNSLRIRMYIKIYREYQAHLDSILEELHKAVDKLEGTPDYDRISLIQSLHGASFVVTAYGAGQP